MDLVERANAFADCSIYYYNKGELRLAIKYWNKIYSLPMNSIDRVLVMRKFTDEQVYTITDRIRFCYYRGVGLL